MDNRADKNWNNFFLGLVVVVWPWLGLPASWKSVGLVILGVLIMLFALARFGRQRTNVGDEQTAPQV